MATMTREEIQAEIKRLERQLKKLNDQLLAIQAEEQILKAGFSKGDTVYVYEYFDEKRGGRWHPVKVKSFFLDPQGSGSLGFSFTPIDKQGKSLMRWRQVYLCHGNVSIIKPEETPEQSEKEYFKRLFGRAFAPNRHEQTAEGGWKHITDTTHLA